MDYIVVLIIGLFLGMFIASLFSINEKDNDEMIKEFKKRKRKSK